MSKRVALRRTGRVAAFSAVAATTLLTTGPMAMAAVPVSQSSANALTADLTAIVLGVHLDTGTPTAVNNGSPAKVVAGSGTVSYDATSLVTAGALQQTAVANSDGTSSGCAGLVGNGASIQIGQTPRCDLTTTNGEVGGVTVGGVIQQGLVDATAIVETCSADANGNATATAHLVDASALNKTVVINDDPAPNTTVAKASALGGTVTIESNKQTTAPDGKSIKATALEITFTPLLGISTTIDIGTVTCGPNSLMLGNSPVFPVESLPIVFGLTGVAGVVTIVWSRRRRAAAPVA